MALRAIVSAVRNNLKAHKNEAPPVKHEKEARPFTTGPFRAHIPDATGPIPVDVLKLIFGTLKSAQEIGRCAIVCRQWRAVTIKHDDLWKRFAFEKVLGKRVWEDNVYVDVGIEPRYRIGGKAISWRDVCYIQRQPSLFRVKKGTMIEVDFLVPKTMNGKPTTIKRVMEVFAKAKKPVGLRDISEKIIKKYGDVPVEESYFARITFTIDEDTRSFDISSPVNREEMIKKKGKGLYRLPKVIEMMIYTFLARQVNAPYDYYVKSPSTSFSECDETIEDKGRVLSVMCGGFKEPTPTSPGGLYVSFPVFDNENNGAGALWEF